MEVVKPNKTLNQKNFKRAKKASPIGHVSSDDPTFLLVHGDKDVSVPISLSYDFLKNLKETNIPSKLIVVEGAGHGPIFPGAKNLPDLNSEYVKWMDLYLKN